MNVFDGVDVHNLSSSVRLRAIFASWSRGTSLVVQIIKHVVAYYAVAPSLQAGDGARVDVL